jgi:hypothetical protein
MIIKQSISKIYINSMALNIGFEEVFAGAIG